MTTKQRAFLSKYLDDKTIDYISKLDSKIFVSNCIDFIIKTNKTFSIFVSNYNKTERIVELEKYINANKHLYSGPKDENYRYLQTNAIPKSDIKSFTFEQSWCKGMSSHVTRKYTIVDIFGNEISHNIQYEALFRLGINTLSQFFKYLQENDMKLCLE